MEIKNQEQLEIAFQKLDILIAEGFDGDSEKELRFKETALMIEQYEDTVLELMSLKNYEY